MSLSDSFVKHGVTAVVFDSTAVIHATRAVLAVLQQHGQRRVTALAVAGLLVRMQAELAEDTLDNTIELMRSFIVSMAESGDLGFKA